MPQGTLPSGAVRALRDLRSGLDMVFQRVAVDRVVDRAWLDAAIDRAIAARRSGFIHIQAKAGAGKTAYLARRVKRDQPPYFFFDAPQKVTGNRYTRPLSTARAGRGATWRAAHLRRRLAR
jgi:hypothetical protein